MIRSSKIVTLVKHLVVRLFDVFKGRDLIAARLGHEPANCTALQYYPGYEPSDYQLVSKYATQRAFICEDHYVDAFGVKTNVACVPFTISDAKLERLQFPLPDDGLHAEGIEYAAILNAFSRRRVKPRFVVVEIGSGWGPWIGLAGVLAKNEGLKDVTLIGAEASPERFRQMVKHLTVNGLISSSGFDVRCIDKAVWVFDGEINFPVSSVDGMGEAATENTAERDYRGHAKRFIKVPCALISSMCDGVGLIDFVHIDIQGAESKIIVNEIQWLTENVRSIMIATHSRVIEGALIKVLSEAGWILKREKPCRFNLESPAKAYEGKTYADGSQYWINPSR